MEATPTHTAPHRAPHRAPHTAALDTAYGGTAETVSAVTAASPVRAADGTPAYAALLELKRLAHEQRAGHIDITHTCADTLRYGMCLSDGRD